MCFLSGDFWKYLRKKSLTFLAKIFFWNFAVFSELQKNEDRNFENKKEEEINFFDD